MELIALDRLVKFTEDVHTDESEVYEYLKEELCKFEFPKYSSVVLGCTHFPVYRDIFKKILPDNIEVIDSSKGVVKNLKKHVQEFEKENDLFKNNDKKVNLMLSKYDEEFILNFKKITGLNDIKII